MPRRPRNGAVSKVVEAAVRAGFRQAYNQVQVDPARFLRHMQRSYGLPVRAWQEMQYLDERQIEPHSKRIISAASKVAALEGMGLGAGGLITILPDMGFLSAITIRMLQRLSLIHGFEYANDEEVTLLWIAAASAAGLDLGRDFIEKQAMERVVPRIIDRIAVKVGTEVAEKWSGRLIPVLSAGIGATLNYYFVRSWGRRAEQHFLERHRAARGRRLSAAMLPAASTALPRPS